MGSSEPTSIYLAVTNMQITQFYIFQSRPHFSGLNLWMQLSICHLFLDICKHLKCIIISKTKLMICVSPNLMLFWCSLCQCGQPHHRAVDTRTLGDILATSLSLSQSIYHQDVSTSLHHLSLHLHHHLGPRYHHGFSDLPESHSSHASHLSSSTLAPLSSTL